MNNRRRVPDYSDCACIPAVIRAVTWDLVLGLAMVVLFAGAMEWPL